MFGNNILLTNIYNLKFKINNKNSELTLSAIFFFFSITYCLFINKHVHQYTLHSGLLIFRVSILYDKPNALFVNVAL